MADRFVRARRRIRGQSKRLTEFQKLLLRWYARHGRSFPWRKKNASEFVQIVSEVLLQRTQANCVAEFLPRFLKSFSSWADVNSADVESVGELLTSLGLWRRRAISLKKLAREMVVLQSNFPRSRAEAETLPGVGQYVASAVLLFCHGDQVPLLDVNMARVLERCFGPRDLVDIRFDPWLQLLSHAVTKHPRCRDVNWAILDLAALICKVRQPLCEKCPVRRICKFANRRRIVAD